MNKREQNEVTSDNQISSYFVDILRHLIEDLNSQKVVRELLVYYNS